MDAKIGIGITKSASLARTTGSSTLMESVFQFLTNAPHTLKTETVNHATKVMILRKENAFSLTSTMLSLLTLDVVLGIGTIKSASPAPTISFSMLMESVFQFLTNALLTKKMETALHALRDTT